MSLVCSECRALHYRLRKLEGQACDVKESA